MSMYAVLVRNNGHKHMLADKLLKESALYFLELFLTIFGGGDGDNSGGGGGYS
jgi:hypothetical protein